jgi:hypothetical protein
MMRIMQPMKKEDNNEKPDLNPKTTSYLAVSYSKKQDKLLLLFMVQLE